MLLIILKGLIAFIFGFSGINKMYFDEKVLVSKGQTGVEGLNKYFIKFIGFSELLGALAIVLGFFVESIMFLTPIAIVCLGLIMIPAAFIHFKRGELKNVFINILILLTCVAIVYGIFKTERESYKSETLIIRQLDTNLYVHTSYLDIKNYGKFPCNGIIYKNGDECIVLDTPPDEEASKELISWIKRTLKSDIVAIVPTHFHVDCLGGLTEFHKENITSIANNKTIEFAKNQDVVLPNSGFDKSITLDVGITNVVVSFFGEGHTKDNVVAYIPSEKTLFGGCLIKELNASKGNLNDANTQQWSKTVELIKQEYPDLKYVIPGHGRYGGVELLDYPIKLFNEKID